MAQMNDHHVPKAGESEFESAQFDVNDILSMTDKYKEKRDEAEIGGAKGEPATAEDAATRRRKLLEQIQVEEVRPADGASPGTVQMNSEVSWLLQVHKLQNILNNQIYGMCLGLLNN